MILAFGCSHTAGVLNKNLSWPQLYDGRDKVKVFAEGGNSFQQQVEKATQINKNRTPWLRFPKALVLQKTHPCRYPWFCAPNKFSAARAYQLYFSLPEMMREELLHDILQLDKNLLDELIECFPTVAKRAIWSYWIDAYLDDKVTVKYIQEFHKYAITRGFDDLGTIVDADLITKEADQLGQYSKEWFQFLYEQKWICAPDDPHASTEVNKRIADKIREWAEQ